jgi:hypothetical protein
MSDEVRFVEADGHFMPREHPGLFNEKLSRVLARTRTA